MTQNYKLSQKLFFFLAKTLCLIFFLLSSLQTLSFAQCGNISSANCPDLIVALPFNVNFNGTEGGLKDTTTKDIGFRMVQHHSQPRLVEDLPISNATVSGYEKKWLEIKNGNLELTANKGTNFVKPTAADANTQVNALGVGIQQTNTEFEIETTTIYLTTGGGNAYAGLWYGLDEDNYVKLTIISTTIELRIERNGVSNFATDRLASATLAGVLTNPVKLRMVVNNIGAIKKVQAYYRVGNLPEQYLGELVHNFAQGITLADGTTQNVSFAGVMASYRTGTKFIATFDYFKITPVAKGLKFTPDVLNTSLNYGNNTTTITSNLIPTGSLPSGFTLSKTNGINWLTLPNSPNLGNLNFGINTSGLLPGTYTADVLAKAPGAEGFADGKLKVTLKVLPKTLVFSLPELNFSIPQNGSTTNQTIQLIPEDGTPNINLKTTLLGDWLILPANPSVGTLSLNVNGAGLLPGTYQTFLTATSSGYADAKVKVNLTVEELPLPTIDWVHRINFQNNVTAPTGYIKDIGEPYGNRGNGRTFGWIDPAFGTPKSVVNYARNRTDQTSFTLEQRTLNQMQILGFEANWEMELPNGAYYIKIISGDCSNNAGDLAGHHVINAEGTKMIDFEQNGVSGFQEKVKLINITDGKLTLDSKGGTRTKISSIQIGKVATANDNIAPSVKANFEGVQENDNVFVNQVKISADTLDLGGSGIDLLEFSLNSATYQTYTKPLFLNEIGDYKISFKAKDRNNNITTTAYQNFKIKKPITKNVRMVIENFYKFPDNDNYTFSFVQKRYTTVLYGPNYECPDYNVSDNYNHDSNEIRIYNYGTEPLIINDLVLSDEVNFKITRLGGITMANFKDYLPLVIQPNTFTDVTVIFATRGLELDLATRIKLYHATLTIKSNDSAKPNKILNLHAVYQEKQEGGQEPTTQEFIEAIGFKTNTGFTTVNNNHAYPIGDEIFSPYFVRADTNKNAYMRLFASYHTLPSTAVMKYRRKGNTNTNTTNLIAHTNKDSQTLLPRKNGTLGLGDASFKLPVFNGNTNYPFAIKLATDDTDPLFSDTYVQYQNTPTYKDANGNPFRGARVWKAVNFEGKVIPNAYLISHDYLYGSATDVSSNLDYNDNAVYVENIRPEIGTAFYSELKGGNGLVGNAQQNQSSLDFGSAVIGTSNQLTLNLRSLGQSYANGSIDPPINIEKVEIEGANYDEFSAANPIKMQLNAGETTTMIVKFNPALVGLKNATLLIHHNFGNSPLRVPLYALATSPCYNLTLAKRIKSAVDADMTIDGVVWEKDNTYRKNATGTGNNLVQLDNITTGSTDIQLTDRDNLYIRYLSSKQNNVGIRYEVPVNATGNGKYLVRLHFSENYFTAVNMRVNDIYIEGQLKLPAFDIFREVGSRTATFRDFEIDIADNKLDIKFVSLVNRPSICGIEIYKISSNSALMLNSTLITPASCGASNGSIQVQATGISGGATVSYKLGKYGVYQSNPIFSNLAAGEYTIYVKENIAGGCEAQKTFIIPQNDSFITFITAKTPTGCGANYDGSANITNISGGAAPYAITWNTPQPQFGSMATGLDNGTVTFAITDAMGCSKLGSVNIDSCIAAPNNIPIVSNAINDVNVFKNANATILDLSSVFTDADNETLVKTVISNSNTNTVTTTLIGNTLTLNYVLGASGIANIKVRATDPQGAIVDDEFKVTVTNINTSVTQMNKNVLAGRNDGQILKIQIDNPVGLNLNATNFKFKTTGTTDVNDIISVKLFNSGNSPLFINPTIVGSAINNPNGQFEFTGFNLNLLTNANYFWLVYEVRNTAFVGNSLDAELVSVNLKGTEVFPDNGNPLGNRSIKTTDAKPGKMLTFDGTNDFVELPDEERFDFTNAMTVETWVKVGAFDKTFQAFVSKGNTWILSRQNNTNFASFRIINNVGATINANGTVTNINDGKWHHLAGTYNGTQAILYVDGKLEKTTNYTGTIAVDNRNVFIGANAQDANKFFNGKMDEVRIWNVARTQAQIREFMHLTLQGTETGLISYWQFNQDNGTLAPDLVGGSDGILKNANDANWINANHPVAKGVSQTATPLLNTTVNFDNVGLRITFGAVFPNGNIVVSRLENVSPAGADVSPGKLKTTSYWVINNFGTNTGYSPMTLRFYVNDGFLLSANPSDYKLYKRASRDDEEAWTDEYIAATINTNEKYIEFTGITNFSQAIIAGADASLPIRLVAFNVNRLNENTAKLEWTTALEENNKGFEIQKSLNGMQFETIAFVEGAGNSVQIKNYNFLDEDAAYAAYYRLKQIDFDGKYDYSPIQYLQGIEQDFIYIFPNPTQSTVNFDVSEDVAKNQSLRVDLMDAKGSILTQKTGNIHQIKQAVNNKLSDLGSGLYFVKITANNKAYLLRLVKQ